MSYRKNRAPNSTLSRSAFLESQHSFRKRNNSKQWREASSLSFYKRDDKGDNESGYIEHRDLYNGNVSKFREIFNSNDISQLPFMATLRNYPKTARTTSSDWKDSSTVTKPTHNQQTKKRITDFKVNTSVLAPVYFRWHNRSGRNNLWSTQFECSLRKYGDKFNPEEKNYNKLQQPIVYMDVEPKIYCQSQLVCPRQQRLFRIKRQ